MFLATTKQPPLHIVKQFLTEHGNKTVTQCIICMDQGGELAKSQLFQQTVADAGFLLEPTAANAPFQNGLAGQPNQSLGQTMRCLLHVAELGPEYWSFALLHAVYLKNYLLHTATH